MIGQPAASLDSGGKVLETMKKNHSSRRTSRRHFLQLAAGAGVSGSVLLNAPAVAVPTGSAETAVAARVGDGRIGIEFDSAMRSRLRRGDRPGSAPLTPWSATETLELADGTRLEHFTLLQHAQQAVDGEHGPGVQWLLLGSDARVEKTVSIELSERYPGFAIYRVTYRNRSSAPLKVAGWRNGALRLLPLAAVAHPGDPPFWSYCGSTHSDRRDWVQPVRPGFDQPNFMGMEASDYGGGTPIVDVWRPDCGVAVGHLELTPELVSLPLQCSSAGASVALTKATVRLLQPGERLETHQAFIALHDGDYFNVLDAYRRLMAERGVQSPAPPAAAYEPIWCAWGYERACTTQLIVDTLPKVRDL